MEWRTRRHGNLALFDNLKDNDVEFCINRSLIDNVVGLIIHNNEPKLSRQCVWSEHHDLEMAKIMLFIVDAIFTLKIV